MKPAQEVKETAGGDGAEEAVSNDEEEMAFETNKEVTAIGKDVEVKAG